MHRRYDSINIPIEVIRTLVVIADTGSFSKAGAKLGLSQPAISAQIKRLQMLVGGPVFDRVPGGVALTALGKLVLFQARKLLEANDQILLLAGTPSQPHPVRVGIVTLYIDAFLEIASANRAIGQLPLHCSHSPDLANQLAEGYIDVACLLSPTNDLDSAVEWQENFVWACSPDFVLSPDSFLVAPYVGAYADYYLTRDHDTTTALIPEIFQGFSARVTSGIALSKAGGASLAVGGELGGLGGNNLSHWSIRARGSIPF
jgi:DNA-binding transcriptional LysR family regulator